MTVLPAARDLDAYFATLSALPSRTAVTDAAGDALDLAAGMGRVAGLLGGLAAGENRVFFIGNGGSAGIASHAAIDYSKNGGFPALALTDGAALTCLGNDYGYDEVFARQLEFHARRGDVLMAVSSSGASANILKAVAAARARGCRVVTFSGFSPANPLRRLGDVNFYVDNGEYGFVEIFHLTLIHAVLDLGTGWRAAMRTAE